MTERYRALCSIEEDAEVWRVGEGVGMGVGGAEEKGGEREEK